MTKNVFILASYVINICRVSRYALTLSFSGHRVTPEDGIQSRQKVDLKEVIQRVQLRVRTDEMFRTMQIFSIPRSFRSVPNV